MGAMSSGSGKANQRAKDAAMAARMQKEGPRAPKSWRPGEVKLIRVRGGGEWKGNSKWENAMAAGFGLFASDPINYKITGVTLA